MVQDFVLNAKERDLFGTSSSRRLRLSGFVPAVIYGAKKPMFLLLDKNDVAIAMKNPKFYSAIIEININNKKFKVILKDYQLHVIKKQTLHIDFLHVKK